MSSIRCQNAILDLLRGIVDEDDPSVKLIPKINISGGSPAIDAIEDMFKGGNDGDVEENGEEINENSNENGEVVEDTNPAMRGGEVEGNIDENGNENIVIDDGEYVQASEGIPNDEDGKVVVDKDDEGEVISDDIEQPNNDNSEVEKKEDLDDELFMLTGGAPDIRSIRVITPEMKFPWIMKNKHRID